jgi:hypothetical protein
MYRLQRNHGYKLAARAVGKMMAYLAEVEEGKVPPPIK